jgi:hypothetical protein
MLFLRVILNWVDQISQSHRIKPVVHEPVDRHSTKISQCFRGISVRLFIYVLGLYASHVFSHVRFQHQQHEKLAGVSELVTFVCVRSGTSAALSSLSGSRCPI